MTSNIHFSSFFYVDDVTLVLGTIRSPCGIVSLNTRIVASERALPSPNRDGRSRVHLTHQAHANVTPMVIPTLSAERVAAPTWNFCRHANGLCRQHCIKGTNYHRTREISDLDYKVHLKRGSVLTFGCVPIRRTEKRFALGSRQWPAAATVDLVHGKNVRWDSMQRTGTIVAESHKIYLCSRETGEHPSSLSCGEDGFEFTNGLMTRIAIVNRRVRPMPAVRGHAGTRSSASRSSPDSRPNRLRKNVWQCYRLHATRRASPLMPALMFTMQDQGIARSKKTGWRINPEKSNTARRNGRFPITG